MKFVKTVIKDDITSPIIYVRGKQKSGKSTVYRDICLEMERRKKLDPYSFGISIGIGAENANTMLDGLIKPMEEIETWAQFIDTVDTLVNRKTNDSGLDHLGLVSIDTIGELILLAEKQAVEDGNAEARRVHQSKRNPGPFTPVRSVLSAFGGYGEGKKYAIKNLVIPQLKKLQSSGLGVWIIGHSKIKTVSKVDGLEKVEYETLTSDLEKTYEEALAGFVDGIITFTDYFDQDDYTEEQKTGFGQTKTVRRAKSIGKNRAYFRTTPTVESGGRFKFGSVPEYLEFEAGKIDPIVIMDTIVEGMRLSKSENAKELAAKLEGLSIEVDVKEPEKTIVENSIFDLSEPETDVFAEELPVEEPVPAADPEPEIDFEALKKDIQANFKNIQDASVKARVQQIVKSNGSISACSSDDLLVIKGLMNL